MLFNPESKVLILQSVFPSVCIHTMWIHHKGLDHANTALKQALLCHLQIYILDISYRHQGLQLFLLSLIVHIGFFSFDFTFVTGLGYKILSVTMIIIFLFIKINIKNIPDIKTKENRKINLSCLRELLFNKKYVLLVILYFFIFFMPSAELLLLGIKLNYLGGTAAVGMFFGIQALSEIPTMVFYNKICKKISTKNILIFATLFYAIREILFAMVGTTMLMYIVSWTDAFTYAFAYIGAKFLSSLFGLISFILAVIYKIVCRRNILQYENH